MKLYYYKDPKGNFGDDINPWLWPKIMPEVFDDDDREIFVGIGTLINHRLPDLPKKHIFGSGVGYGRPPEIDDSYAIHSVRGHKTAEVLGLRKGLATTDPAILIRLLNPRTATERDHAVGFMPHGDSLSHFDWEAFCADAGMYFISSQWDVERVIFEISRCRLLLAEAMHGAIVADALRTPWLPLDCYGQTLAFKWQDWLSTTDIDYRPRRITPLYALRRDLPSLDRIKIRLKQFLRNHGIERSSWTPPPPSDSRASVFDEVKDQLLRISKETPLLSSEKVSNDHLDRYVSIVHGFRMRVKTI